jgi:hypothetical protein
VEVSVVVNLGGDVLIRAKFIIAFFLFLSAFLFIGECYTFVLQGFMEHYRYVPYTLNYEEDPEELRALVLSESEKYALPMFSVRMERGGAFSNTITVYGDEDALEALNKDWGIETGVKSSFFSGKTTFICKPLSDAPTKQILNNSYYIATRDEIAPMLASYLGANTGGYNRNGMPDESRSIVLTVWCVVALVILLLSYYDTVYSRKEQIVKIVLGADARLLTLRKIVTDLCVYTAGALAAILLIRLFTNSFFRWEVSLASFVALLILDAGVLAFGMRTGDKLRIRAAVSAKKALTMSVAIKWFVALLTVIVLSLAIGLTVSGVQLYVQKDSYAEMKDVAHVSVNYPFDSEKMEMSEFWAGDNPPLATYEQITDNFLRYSYRSLNCSMMIYDASIAGMELQWTDKVLIANINGLTPYKSAFPNWDEMTSKEGCYLLVPEGLDPAQVKREFTEIDFSDSREYSAFPYSENISVIAENHHPQLEYRYTFELKNPVILLDTVDYGAMPLYPPTYELQQQDEKYGFIGDPQNQNYLSQFSKMNNDPATIRSFAAELHSDIIDPALMEYEIIDVYDWFKELWALQNRSLLIAVILTLMALALEMQISAIVLRLEYEVNAQELTIKRVMGFSVFERYKNLFAITVIICAACFTGAVIVAAYFKIAIVSYLAYGSAAVLVIDLTMLSIMIKRNDRVQIQRVLKGGL